MQKKGGVNIVCIDAYFFCAFTLLLTYICKLSTFTVSKPVLCWQCFILSISSSRLSFNWCWENIDDYLFITKKN